MITRTNSAGQAGVSEIAETTTAAMIGRGATAITDAREIEGFIPTGTETEITKGQTTSILTMPRRGEETEGAIATAMTHTGNMIKGVVEAREGLQAATAMIAIVVAIAKNANNPATIIETIEEACLLRRLVRP